MIIYDITILSVVFISVFISVLWLNKPLRMKRQEMEKQIEKQDYNMWKKSKYIKYL